MPIDLDIIAQLEKRIGRKLKKLDKVGLDLVGYKLNKRRHVIDLGLYQNELSELPAEIVQLQNFEFSVQDINF